MGTLKTPAEYGDDGRLTERCIASLLSEIDASHKPRMNAIKGALRQMGRGDTMDLNFNFTFGKEAQ